MFRHQLLLILSGFFLLSSCGKEVTYVCLEDDPPIAECCADDPTLSYCQSTGDMGNNTPDMPADQNPNNTPDATNNEPDADQDMPDPDMAPACLEVCGGPTPVCDEASGNCVECVESNDCTGGVCLNNTCVECANNADCASGACDIPNNTCVECLSNLTCPGGVCEVISKTCTPCLNSNDCVAPGATQCKVDDANLTQNTCVECLDNTPCTTPAAARCGTTNACGPCQDAADCAQVPNTNQCNAGTCVQCTPATQAADCANKVCDPSALTCTGVDIAATPPLNTCAFDDQCLANHACIPLNFMGTPHGNYCMPHFVVGTPCGKPYGDGGVTRTSVGGQSVNVCMIKDITTPEAIADYEESCTEANAATDCPAVGARCEIRRPSSVDMSRICTYSCSGNNDCITGASCVGPINAKYCGAE